MKRYLFILFPICLAGALAWADESSSDADRAVRLQRNLRLIEVLVDGGLKLAGEDDPLRRAGHCSDMADQMVKEIRRATAAREAPRVIELGRHLHSLLNEGVGGNLNQARGIPPGSAEEKHLQELRSRAVWLISDLEEDLERVIAGAPQAENQADMQNALEELQKGRKVVEGTLRSSSKPKAKGKNSK
jgi:hypothetical protein